MAPTEAQGVTMCVRPFVRSVQICLEQSILIFLGQRAIRAHRDHSKSNQRTLREQSESNQSIKIRVIQSEPKILRLVEFKIKECGAVSIKVSSV